MSKKILIVEDEEDLLETIAEFFEESGFSVLTASQGYEALGHLSKNKVDIVVTDVVMPDMDGIELLNSIRSKYPEIPVIAQSGGGRIGAENYLELAKGLGAFAVFRKPLMMNELLESIEQALEEN